MSKLIAQCQCCATSEVAKTFWKKWQPDPTVTARLKIHRARDTYVSRIHGSASS
ncbi:predicted protein [Botrytis cinerea T4]|uniref:Uncharacterized protein n=1 Tax=Botryotinia fuckeliana (strain T4) TaxID=999810 RepID=G2YHM8_BOTF4|nr:predicted protein [Botrytis cinerea T4]